MYDNGCSGIAEVTGFAGLGHNVTSPIPSAILREMLLHVSHLQSMSLKRMCDISIRVNPLIVISSIPVISNTPLHYSSIPAIQVLSFSVH